MLIERQNGAAPERLIVESTSDLSDVARLSQEQRLSELGLLAAGIAHELKNPLAGIEVMAGLLRRQVLDALIDERVQLTYARDSGPRLDEAEVDRAVANVAAQADGEDENFVARFGGKPVMMSDRASYLVSGSSPQAYYTIGAKASASNWCRSERASLKNWRALSARHSTSIDLGRERSTASTLPSAFAKPYRVS